MFVHTVVYKFDQGQVSKSLLFGYLFHEYTSSPLLLFFSYLFDSRVAV